MIYCHCHPSFTLYFIIFRVFFFFCRCIVASILRTYMNCVCTHIILPLLIVSIRLLMASIRFWLLFFYGFHSTNFDHFKGINKLRVYSSEVIKSADQTGAQRICHTTAFYVFHINLFTSDVYSLFITIHFCYHS